MQHHHFAVCVSRFKGNKSMLDSLCTECLSLCLPFVFLVFLLMTVWLISSYFLATLVFWLSHVCCTCHCTTWHEHSRGCWTILITVLNVHCCTSWRFTDTQNTFKGCSLLMLLEEKPAYSLLGSCRINCDGKREDRSSSRSKAK